MVQQESEGMRACSGCARDSVVPSLAVGVLVLRAALRPTSERRAGNGMKVRVRRIAAAGVWGHGRGHRALFVHGDHHCELNFAAMSLSSMHSEHYTERVVLRRESVSV